MKNNPEILDEPIDKEERTADAPQPDKQLISLNDSSIYYKGLIGMILCILPGAIIGLMFIKMSLDQAKEANVTIEMYPGKYPEPLIKKVQDGSTMARIGLTMFVVEIIALIAYMSIIS